MLKNNFNLSVARLYKPTSLPGKPPLNSTRLIYDARNLSYDIRARSR